jgi:hypothetical protein
VTTAISLSLLLLGSCGVLVPVIGLLTYRDFRRRVAHMPAATALENVVEQLAVKQEDLRQAEQKLADFAEQMVRRDMVVTEAEEHLARLHQAQADLETLQPKLLELENLNQELARQHEALASVTEQVVQAEARLREQQDQVRRAEQRHADLSEATERGRRQLDAAEQHLAILQEQKAGLEAEVSSLRAALSDLEHQRNTVQEDMGEAQARLQRLQQEAEEEHKKVLSLKAEAAGLEAMKASLQGFVLQAKAVKEEQEEGRLADLFRSPDCLRAASLPGPRRPVDEEAAVDGLRAHLGAVGLQFSQRTLDCFHTCLKTASISPLTVLAGISGTGKSELPRRYAEGMGMHFLQVAVQPRWDGPQDLFGFYNYLEHRFVATDLSRALVHLDEFNHAEHANPFAGRMLIVLLDEMNLARVEYYFSELLSRLEVRRSVEVANAMSRQQAEVVLSAGGGGEDNDLRFFVSDRVLFVGTMNEDESTQTLSDKVIDRSNVYRFGRPTKMSHSEPNAAGQPASQYLSHDVWKSWHREPDRDLEDGPRRQLRKRIEDLNSILEQLGRPFGHRMNQAMQAYVANYPNVKSGRRLWDAFSDQLELRILPKLRGVETGSYDTPLNSLQRMITDLGDEALERSFEAAKAQPLFNWAGVDREGNDRNPRR